MRLLVATRKIKGKVMSSLPPAIQPVRERVKRVLTQIYGERLSAVYLCGSYARGDYREDSDVDLMIALKGEVNPTQEINRLSKVLSDISLDYGLLIATYPVSEAWLQERHGPLFVNVRREGVRL
jgi:predicted nucleotidyltransferase